MSAPSKEILASAIECALFDPLARRTDIERLCAEAREKKWHAVAVNSANVELAYTLLEESDVKVVALVGFPFGTSEADVKRYEVETAIDYGAHEIDYVINLGRLKDSDHKFILREMRDIAESADELPVKAILETHLLTIEERILACQLALDGGIQFVSTSTDFNAPSVNAEDVKLLRETVGPEFGIKAAGQIRDVATAQKLIEAGATRIGILAGTTFS